MRQKLNYLEAVEKAMPVVLAVRKPVFPQIPDDTVKGVFQSTNPYIEGDHWIEFGGYVMTPIEGSRKSITGEVSIIKWNLTLHYMSHGSYDNPPEEMEKDHGNFDTIGECLTKIGEVEIYEHIASIMEGLDHERFAAEEEKYLQDMENRPLEQHLCPHGREFHECNSCMIASDQAYDAAREKRLR